MMARDRAGRGWLPGIAGLLVAAAAGLWLLTGYTKQPVHPDAQAIASVRQKEPSPQWAAAVAGARRTLRASIAAENVPGLSVAVGAGGEIVWSEGFGWADLKSRVPVTRAVRYIAQLEPLPTAAGANGINRANADIEHCRDFFSSNATIPERPNFKNLFFSNDCPRVFRAIHRC